MENMEQSHELVFEEVEGGTIGTFNGFYFSKNYGQQGYFKGTFLNFSFKSKITSKDYRKAIKGARGFQLILREFMENADTLSVFLPKKYKEEKLIAFLTTITKNFKHMGLQQHQVCATCGEEADIIVRKGFAVRMHEECLHKYNESVIMVNRQQAQDGSLPLSILLAVLGAVVGALPSLILILTIGYINAFLFALIPIASYYGYKMGKAPTGKISIILFVILSVIISVSLIVILYVVEATSVSNTLIDYINVTPEVKAKFIQDILLAVLFSLIGVAIAWGAITKSNKKSTL